MLQIGTCSIKENATLRQRFFSARRASLLLGRLCERVSLCQAAVSCSSMCLRHSSKVFCSLGSCGTGKPYKSAPVSECLCCIAGHKSSYAGCTSMLRSALVAVAARSNICTAPPAVNVANKPACARCWQLQGVFVHHANAKAYTRLQMKQQDRRKAQCNQADARWVCVILNHSIAYFLQPEQCSLLKCWCAAPARHTKMLTPTSPIRP